MKRALLIGLIGVGVLAVVIIAYALNTPTIQFTNRLPTPTPGLVIRPTPGQVISLQGAKNILTDPIPVYPGAYQIQWEALNPAPAACATRMTLRAADSPDPPALVIVDQSVPAGQDARGAVTWAPTEGGYYRIQVLSRCGWTLQIGAQ